MREYIVEFELSTSRLDSLDKATLMEFFIWDCTKRLRNGCPFCTRLLYHKQ